MTVQCYLPRLAYDALDHELIRATARFAGVERPRWEWSTAKIPNYAPAASGCLTVNDEMAACLLEAFKHRLEKARAKQDRELVVALSSAIDTLSAAIQQAHAPRDRSPGFGVNS